VESALRAGPSLSSPEITADASTTINDHLDRRRGLSRSPPPQYRDQGVPA
jgi:hypothetical protein